MSSEESETGSEHEDDEEGAPRTRKTLVTRKLPWRSQEIENAFKNLDKRVERRRSPKATSMALSRRFSEVRSDRLAPLDAPRWALRPASQSNECHRDLTETHLE